MSIDFNPRDLRRGTVVGSDEPLIPQGSPSPGPRPPPSTRPSVVVYAEPRPASPEGGSGKAVGYDEINWTCTRTGRSCSARSAS